MPYNVYVSTVDGKILGVRRTEAVDLKSQVPHEIVEVKDDWGFDKNKGVKQEDGTWSFFFEDTTVSG